jgi:hypothetical protein
VEQWAGVSVSVLPQAVTECQVEANYQGVAVRVEEQQEEVLA